MKLRKRKLFSSMAFVLSLVMLVVSGAVFVHTATQQSASTSLSVTFNGMNVNFSAQAWYQVDNDSPAAGHKKELVTTSGASGGISFSATAPSGSQVLKVADAENPIQLNANDTFVLFTYKFTNTASSNAKGMLVSLSNSGVANNSNLSVKYYTSTTDYTATGLSTQYNAVVASQQTEFSNVFISAQSTKYFYILVSLIDNTLGATYDKSSSPLNWTITCSEETEEVIPVTITLTPYQCEGDGHPLYKIYNSSDNLPTQDSDVFDNNTLGPHSSLNMTAFYETVTLYNLTVGQYLLITAHNLYAGFIMRDGIEPFHQLPTEGHWFLVQVSTDIHYFISVGAGSAIN